MEGKTKGVVYAHAYFSASVEKTLAADNFGPQFAGLTSVALTAFMVESYLNYICECIYDYEKRATKYLDDADATEIIRILDSLEKGKKDDSIESMLADALGYKCEANLMMKSLRKSVRKNQKDEFDANVQGLIAFHLIENNFKFSSIDKLKAVLKASKASQPEYDKWLQQNYILFNARNALAHGRTEYIDSSFISNNEQSISDLVPTVSSSWQEACSLENAKEMYSSSKMLVSYLNNAFLKELMPLNNLSSQLSAVS